MANRPTVGGSDGTWGTELNAHLDVSLDTDGKVDDGAEQTTDAAPGADKELVNKKYADALIAAIQDPTYSGGESHTFDGGLIIKMGVAAETGTTHTVTFETPFPNALVTVLTSGTTAATPGYVSTITKSVSAFFVSIAGTQNGLNWIAIGY